jgi:hypothetical protein
MQIISEIYLPGKSIFISRQLFCANSLKVKKRLKYSMKWFTMVSSGRKWWKVEQSGDKVVPLGGRCVQTC